MFFFFLMIFQVIPDIVVSVGEAVERQGIGSHSWDPPSDLRSACKRLGDSQEVSYEDTSLDVSRLGNFGLAANPETVYWCATPRAAFCVL